jgi:DNA protecting protein DprA
MIPESRCSAAWSPNCRGCSTGSSPLRRPRWPTILKSGRPRESTSSPSSTGPASPWVGSRRATSYGREVARGLGHELAADGLTVISGLSFGVDTCAHRGALAAGPTVAVLACGADVAYPAAQRPQWRRICDEGLVLSELPPGTVPWRWSFPARDRIIAGLAAATVVVEAAARRDLGVQLGFNFFQE